MFDYHLMTLDLNDKFHMTTLSQIYRYLTVSMTDQRAYDLIAREVGRLTFEEVDSTISYLTSVDNPTGNWKTPFDKLQVQINFEDGSGSMRIYSFFTHLNGKSLRHSRIILQMKNGPTHTMSFEEKQLLPMLLIILKKKDQRKDFFEYSLEVNKKTPRLLLTLRNHLLASSTKNYEYTNYHADTSSRLCIFTKSSQM